MMKLTWNKFVERHQTGFCAVTGYEWKAPSGQLTPVKGMKLPTAYNLLIELLSKICVGDWTIEQKKNKKVNIVRILFQKNDDLTKLSSVFQISQSSPSQSPPCLSMCQFPFDPSDYGKIAKYLGYK